MAITANHLTADNDTTDGTSYTTASIAPGANRLVLVSVLSTRAGATPASPTLSGNGLTYVEVATITYDTIAAPRSRLSVFRAMGAAPSAGAITIDYAGVTHGGALWAVTEYAGVDTSGTNGSGAVRQSATDAINLDVLVDPVLAAFGDAGNWTFIAAGADNNALGTLTEEAGYTQRAEQLMAAVACNLSTSDLNANDTSPSYTVATRDAGAVALEIAVAPSAGGLRGSYGRVVVGFRGNVPN